MATALLVMAAGCTRKSEKDIASHVIVIGLDGWGTWCMETGEAPFIKAMMQEGCYTLDKRTVIPSSSGPN